MSDKSKNKLNVLQQENDTLFRIDETLKQYRRKLIKSSMEDYCLYSNAYYFACKTLLISIQNGRNVLRAIAYPAIFLSRQFLELSFKYIIRGGCIFMDEEFVKQNKNKDGSFKYNHDIADLWCSASKVIRTFTNGKDAFPRINTLVKEFCSIDERSTYFRYPDVDQSVAGNKLSRYDFQLMDISNFIELIDALWGVLNMLCTIVREKICDSDEYNNSFIFSKSDKT